MTKRVYTISVSRDPPISGYGGYDEWLIGPLSNEQADILLDRIQKIIENYSKLFKVEGYFSGSN
jgi:predicted aminopeptidase